MKSERILIMAGGTGGHVFPGLALAAELQHRGYVVEWLGTEQGLESRLVPSAGLPLHFIPIKGVRGKGWLGLVAAPWRIIKAVMIAVRQLKKIDPSLVVGLGGFVAGPGGIAAKLSRRPLIIHEQNAIAGTTNRLLAKIADRVLCAFPKALCNGMWIGNPVRHDIATLPEPTVRLRDREGPVRVLVLGGSRGAQAINQLVPVALKAIQKQIPCEVRHQAGMDKFEQAHEAYAGYESAEVFPFIEDISKQLDWADFVICRAGALTVSELAAAGIGSVLVPFPYAIDDHQTANAKFLADAGAALIFQQHDIDVDTFSEALAAILSSRSRMLEMATAARGLAKLDSTQLFANECEGLIHA